ncbi:hypothetical protein HAX54_006947, partial [Datura stramonium]|nr:hypothetical protein [Datura stramonium]
MDSRANKGKEVATSRKEFKRLRKGVVVSSLVPRAPPSRRFGAKAVEEHGLRWFNAQNEGILCQLEHLLWGKHKDQRYEVEWSASLP